MKLIILGNGFDLHHELKTRFNQFKDYCKINHEELYKTINELINQTTKISKKELDWADIEGIFHEVFLGVYNDENAHENNLESFREIEKIQEDFIKKFNQYLNSEVIPQTQKVKINKKLVKEFEGDPYVITFNYTDTHQKYIKNSEKVFHIHGDVLGKSSYPIIGFYFNPKKHVSKSEDYMKKYDYKIFSKEALYDKMHNKSFFTRLNNYTAKIENEITEIVIIGHSLGKSDEYIIADLIKEVGKFSEFPDNMHEENLKNKSILKIKIYVHDENSEEYKENLEENLKNENIYNTAYVRNAQDTRIVPNIEFQKESYKEESKEILSSDNPKDLESNGAIATQTIKKIQNNFTPINPIVLEIQKNIDLVNPVIKEIQSNKAQINQFVQEFQKNVIPATKQLQEIQRIQKLLK